MTQTNATVIDGVYYAHGGDLRLAERDRFRRVHLTVKGRAIYDTAVHQFEASRDESSLMADVRRACDAGY